MLDARLASEVARASGFDHHLLRIGKDFFSDFASLADKTVNATDGCFGVTGTHEIYLSKRARQLAPVRLTGVFGSEVLRGTSTFTPLSLAAGLLDTGTMQSVRNVVDQFPTGSDPVKFAAFKEVPWSIFGSLSACRSQVTFRTPYLDNSIVRLAFQLPVQLRGSSAPALQLIERADPVLARIPSDMGHLTEGLLSSRLKRFYSKATFKLDYFSNDGMPDWLSFVDPLVDRMTAQGMLVGLHKYLRYRRWFRNELADYISGALSNACSRQAPFWNRQFLSSLAERHIQGRANLVSEINAVLTLDSIDRQLLSATAVENEAFLPEDSLATSTP
jgi:asparagine synthase (glutamine-hydrolysing)